MTLRRGLSALVLLVCALSARRGHTGEASPAVNRQAVPVDAARTVNAKLIGGWFAETEVEGKRRGHFIQLGADGTWHRIEDFFGFRAENHGRWLPDGDGAVLENLGVRLSLSGGRLLLVAGGETLYAFEPRATMPPALRELPSFPRTLSETVAILSAELAEPERIVIAGTLEQDLSRFHHGLGTHIRNRFGLWGPNPALLAACKANHPDEASAVILHALRAHLRNIRPGGRDLDNLERVLSELTLAPVEVRRMPVARLVSTLNQQIRRALRRKGLAEHTLVVELAPPKNDDDRRQREGLWLSHPPGLRAWGQGERASVETSPVDLLRAFKKWLKAPGRLLLEPDFDPRWYHPPDKAPDFASVRWRGDWFEIETSLEEGSDPSSAVRSDEWSMMGDGPPMPVEQAAGYAGVARERIAAGKHVVEIALGAAPAEGTREWRYRVRSRIDDHPDASLALSRDEVLPATLGSDLDRKSRWLDLRRPPRISPTLALSRLRSALGVESTGRVEIRLRRVVLSKSWYYQIALGDEEEGAGGIVTLDGRVLLPGPSRDPDERRR
jgi:hypothetical protein